MRTLLLALLALGVSCVALGSNYQNTMPGDRPIKRLMEKTRFSGPNATPDMLLSLRPRLVVIMFEVWDFCRHYELDCPTWTSIIRKHDGDSGVHSAGRAVDVRTWTIPVPFQMELCDYITKKYPYDGSRPNIRSCLLNDGVSYAGQAAANHLHFQVVR